LRKEKNQPRATSNSGRELRGAEKKRGEHSSKGCEKKKKKQSKRAEEEEMNERVNE